MKAIVYNKKAVPDKLVYSDVEKPVPDDNEVLVKIIAVSVNAADYRSMKMGLIPKKKIFGADYVIDYTKEKFTSSNRSYDIIVAVNGNYPLLACRRILKPDGRYDMVGGALSQIFKSMLFGWVLSFGSKKMRFLAAKSNKKDLEFIVMLANDGKIKPVIDRRFPLDKTPEAIR